MALRKITKRAVKGSLLVQFKFVENEDEWTHSASSNVYKNINGKTLTITPQYPTSIIEVSSTFSMGDVSSTQNNSDNFAVALFVNGSKEYEQLDAGGLMPHGNTFAHTGGRNDRMNTTTRHAHVTNVRTQHGIHHAMIPRSTNSQDIETRVRNQDNDRDFSIKGFFMIAKEIAIPEDQVNSGSVTHDGV